MFHFFKPKPAPQGPIEFGGEVVIEKPAEEVYALLDWADPRNAKRQLGNEVAAIEGAPDRFRMTLAALPGHVFDMIVTEAVPHSAYGFATHITPSVGRLVTSHEHYRLEPLGTGTCRLTLVNTVTFIDGMRMKQLSEEVMIMSVASHNALAKLKIHAEQGAEAVTAVEDRLIV